MSKKTVEGDLSAGRFRVEHRCPVSLAEAPCVLGQPLSSLVQSCPDSSIQLGSPTSPPSKPMMVTVSGPAQEARPLPRYLCFLCSRRWKIEPVVVNKNVSCVDGK
ncbi:Hypothetical predicted protein [Marmota monax]|uniref:Uncharacterized protein n=1 Tax=Marmota monax TaxID=9995 RepID=A0A5E4AJL4_MARMO|nr:Hypothetical predicted protein [Marmota monax]